MIQKNHDTKIQSLKDLLFQLIEKKDWEKTLVIGEYLASLDPEGIMAYQALGFASLNLNNLEESEKYFDMALERGDDDPMTFIQLARIHSSRNDLNGEVFWLKKTLEKDPANLIALYNLALTNLTLGDAGAAKEVLLEIVKKHPDHIPTRRTLADIHRAEQDLDSAEQDLRDAIAVKSTISQLHADLASLLRERERYDDALAEYFQALELDPDHPTRYHDVGATLLAAGKADQAISFLKKATDLAPHEPYLHYELGRALFDAGRYHECELANKAALHHYDSGRYAVKKNLGLNILNSLGLAYLNQSELGEAEECFRKSIGLTASSYFHLGLSLHWQGKYDEAITYLLHAVDLMPEQPVYWDMAGNAWLELGDLEHAREAFRHAIALDPKYPPAQYDLGVVLSRMKGMEDEAKKQFALAISLDETYPLPYYAIACLYALEGNRKLALEHLRKAVDLGFTNRGHADTDTDLDSLRDDPEFLDIMEKMSLQRSNSYRTSVKTDKSRTVDTADGLPEGKKNLTSANAYTSMGDEGWMRYIW